MSGWFARARTVRRADAVFWAQLHLHPPFPVWALAYVRPLALRAVLAVDAFESVVRDLARLLDSQRVGIAFLSYREARDALLAQGSHLDARWLPLGFARSVFCDLGLERDIYAFWLGRRHPPIHEKLLSLCSHRGLVYRFSRTPHDPPTIPELQELAARARYFLVTPPDLSDTRRTGSFSPLTSRYLEGVGAGCRLLGVLPRSGEFEALLPRHAIVECSPDGSDLEEVLAAADADPEFEAKRLEAYEIAHREHGWERRARVIVDAMRSKLEET
jgi:hypothetical protein